jgi:hypothetical protein
VISNAASIIVLNGIVANTGFANVTNSGITGPAGTAFLPAPARR